MILVGQVIDVCLSAIAHQEHLTKLVLESENLEDIPPLTYREITAASKTLCPDLWDRIVRPANIFQVNDPVYVKLSSSFVCGYSKLKRKSI